VVNYIADRIAVMYLGRIVEIGPTATVYADPAHPYTRGLLDSVPKLALDGAEAAFTPIRGEIPSPLAPPDGCRFHPRCPIAAERCACETPALRDLGNSRRAACLLAEQRPCDATSTV
jgi:peptide/nickel transport system ATP-binding protein